MQPALHVCVAVAYLKVCRGPVKEVLRQVSFSVKLT